jgi:hypothetical protein
MQFFWVDVKGGSWETTEREEGYESVYLDEVTAGAGAGAVVLESGLLTTHERKKGYDGKLPCTRMMNNGIHICSMIKQAK